MSEYDSPLRGMRSYNDSALAEDEPLNTSSNGNVSSFLITPPQTREFRGNWNNRTPYRGRGFHNRNQNAFRHSTPYKYNRRNNDNSHFNRGPRNANFNQGENSQGTASGYFHPSMLDNPWAEIEKKYEPVEKKVIPNKLESESSSDDSSEEEGNST